MRQEKATYLIPCEPFRNALSLGCQSLPVLLAGALEILAEKRNEVWVTRSTSSSQGLKWAGASSGLAMN